MILAIKDKLACYYNTEEEKKELLGLFIDTESEIPFFKVFMNIEKEEALSYSNTSKITGFLTKKEDPFDTLIQLRDRGEKAVSFTVKGEKFYTTLNNIYYPRSTSRLAYDSSIDKLISYNFIGKMEDSANNLFSQILKYHNEKIIMRFKVAVQKYMIEYRKEYGQNFWKYLEGYNFFNIADINTIIFKCVGTNFVSGCTVDGEYRCSLENKKYNVEINKDEIENITPIKVSLSINNEDMVSVIEDNLYF